MFSFLQNIAKYCKILENVIEINKSRKFSVKCTYVCIRFIFVQCDTNFLHVAVKDNATAQCI